MASSFAALLFETDRYVQWRNAAAEMCLLQQPTMECLAIYAFFDAFRHHTRSNAPASNLLIFRMPLAVERAAWRHFFSSLA
jgi:hypothetical protein